MTEHCLPRNKLGASSPSTEQVDAADGGGAARASRRRGRVRVIDRKPGARGTVHPLGLPLPSDRFCTATIDAGIGRPQAAAMSSFPERSTDRLSPAATKCCAEAELRWLVAPHDAEWSRSRRTTRGLVRRGDLDGLTGLLLSALRSRA